MKKQLLSFIITIVITQSAMSAVWRVNNIVGVDADFSSIQTANNSSSVNQGDTLYIEPSSGDYGTITLNKKLVLIGPGYFITENPQTQANVNTAYIFKFIFNSGCEGSVVEGLQIQCIDFNTSDLLIQRNLIKINDRYGWIEFKTSNISNIILRDNYITNVYGGSNGGHLIECYVTNVNNILIQNNYIKANPYRDAIYLYPGFSGVIENNVIDGNITIGNSNFNNNIQTSGIFSSINSIFTNNIGSSTQFGTSNGNQQNVTMTNVFVGATGNSTDGQWQLKVGSPAIGAGVGGIDCGMFGGVFPYVLSGIPPIPSIYQHTQTIDYQNQKVNVTISIKSNN